MKLYHLSAMRFFIVWVCMACMSHALAFEVDLDEWVFRSVEKNQLPMTIKNPTDRPMALQVKLFKRSFALDGIETFDDPYTEIVAFPENVIVMPQSKEVVSLVWLKPVMPDKQIPLRLVVTQVPVNLDEDATGDGIDVLYELVKSVYITPPDSKAELVVLEYEFKPDSHEIELVIENKGSAALYSKTLFISVNGQELTVIPYLDFTKEQAFMKRVNFLAGEKRRVAFRLHTDFKLSTLDSLKLLKATEE